MEKKDTDDKVMEDNKRSIRVVTYLIMLIITTLGAGGSVAAMSKHSSAFLGLLIINCIGMFYNASKLYDMAMEKDK